jgi:hypothetical protein
VYDCDDVVDSNNSVENITFDTKLAVPMGEPAV